MIDFEKVRDKTLVGCQQSLMFVSRSLMSLRYIGSYTKSVECRMASLERVVVDVLEDFPKASFSRTCSTSVRNVRSNFRWT